MPPRKAKAPSPKARETAAAAAAARSTAPLTAEGSSEAWVQSKANHLRIANKFLAEVSDAALKAKWGDDWDKVPEEHACSVDLYNLLGDYLASVYIIEGSHTNAGQKLGAKTAIGVWSALINRSKERFKAPTTGPEALVRRNLEPK